MNKKELKKQIDEVVSQIKTNSKDAKFADSLIDKLLSLKGQYDVEPTRVCVEEKDVVKEYDFESVRYIRCKSCIIFQAKGGMSVVVSHRMTALFEHLNVLLDMKDRYESLTDEEKLTYETLYSATTFILELPIFATCDDEFFVGISSDIINRLNRLTEKNLEEPLKEETHKENAEFENLNEVFNQENEKDD